MPELVKTKEELEAKLLDAGEKLVVVDFFAQWCNPCKLIAPKLEEFAKEFEGKLVVLKVDVDESDALATQYKIDVMPTFIFFRLGKVLDQFAGSNVDKLKEVIEKHLNK